MAKRPKTETSSAPTLEATRLEVEALESLVARQKKARRALDELAAQADGNADDVTDGVSVPGSEIINKVMAEMGGDGSMGIYKNEGDTVQNVGMFDLVENWESLLMSVQKAKGPGIYTIKLRDGSGAVVKSVTRSFDPVTTAPAGPVAAANSDLLTLFASMNKSAEDRAARLETALEHSRVETARIQGESSKMIFEVLKGQSGGFLKEIIPLMPVITELVKALRPKEDKDPLERLLDLQEVMENLKGDKVEPSGTVDKVIAALAGALAPATGAALGAMAGARRRPQGPIPPQLPQADAKAVEAARQPPPAVVPVPAPVLPPEVTAAINNAKGKTEGAAPAPEPASVVVELTGSANAEPSTEKREVMSLEPYVENFVTAINSGANPEAAADFIYKNAADKGQDSVIRLAVEQGDWAAVVRDPRLVGHQEWITRLHAKLSSLIEEEEAELAAANNGE